MVILGQPLSKASALQHFNSVCTNIALVDTAAGGEETQGLKAAVATGAMLEISVQKLSIQLRLLVKAPLQRQRAGGFSTLRKPGRDVNLDLFFSWNAN